MGCSSCSSENGNPKGCKSNGGCSTGGCNRLNAYDWLSNDNFYDPSAYNAVEVSFKNGARKGFFWKPQEVHVVTGDMVAVDSSNGYDVGRVTLSGELVRIQMRKKKVGEDRIINKVLRKATHRDIERMHEARQLEKPTMIRARVIARSLGVEMKLGDVEYQADQRKATFYYTAEGRIDFRELVRLYAREFRVKIEMRQIGSRQESGKIGGIGACGRELCCSTWLTEFKSVNTTAARYQNLAINQTKLSGQCGRLKCCLNYELDTYLDELKSFPKNVDKLKTQMGEAVLIKTDIFKGIMYFAYQVKGRRGNIVPVHKDDVKKIKKMNDEGVIPEGLIHAEIESKLAKVDEEMDFADVTGQIELPAEEKKRSKRRYKKRSGNQRHKRGKGPSRSSDKQKQASSKQGERKGKPKHNRGKGNAPKNIKNKGNNEKR